MANPFLLEPPARIALSGGRTSGYMLWRILQAHGGSLPKDVVVTFANTGEEHEATLLFVHEMSSRWATPVHWVEYRRDPTKPYVIGSQGRPLIGCHSFAEVTFATASRKGEPFDALIDVKANYRRLAKDEGPILPNPTDRWCSAEMKARTMDRFMRSLGYEEFTVAVGIRADEPKRAKKLLQSSSGKIDYRVPLLEAKVDLEEVLSFWAAHPFDLGLAHDPVLGTYLGNCNGCFLKRPAKIQASLDHDHSWLPRWAAREEATGATFRRDRPTYTEILNQRTPLVCLPGDEDSGDCLCDKE